MLHCLSVGGGLQIGSAAGEVVQLLPEPVQDVLAKLQEPLARATSAVSPFLRIVSVGSSLTRPCTLLACHCQGWLLRWRA